MFGPIIIICAVLFAGTGAGVSNLKAAHNTTVELTCVAPSDAPFPPAWVMNGSLLLADDGYRTSRDEDTGELIGTLIINGNHSCGTFHAYCRLYSGPIMHNTTLTFEGRLPSPENIHINESNSSLFMRWNPPYSESNTELSFVHVDPHITQYTVYIVDNYTGNFMETVNVTETLFQRSISDDNSCPVYRVTAWNSGGEGDMSVPLPGVRAPKSIAPEDIDILREAGALDIHLHVTDPCTVRIPDYFLVTVTSTDGVIITTVQHQYPVTTVRITTIRVTLPQNDDKCNLNVRISAGNSAGMSSPTNITVGCPTTDYSTDTTTTTTSTGSVTTPTDLVDQTIGTAVGAVVIVAVGALLLLLFILRRCKKTTKVEPPGENVYNKKEEKRNTKGIANSTSGRCNTVPQENYTVHYISVEHAKNVYMESPSLRRPPVHHSDLPPVYSPPAVVDVDTVAVSLQSSTVSYARPGLVYARIDPENHGQPQPPASDNQVHYAQIDYQDQL